MHRREFLATTATTALALGIARSVDAAGETPGKPLIEIRVYHFASPEKQRSYAEFLGQVEIPALNRAGITPVGAFKLLAKDNPALKLTEDSTDLYVVLPHKSVESILGLEGRLAGDEACQKAGAATIAPPKSDPAYLRYESSLLSAFDMFPQVQVPTKDPGRLIQLRTYESHSRERAQKKLEMFQQGGELPIFKRAGLPGVFFGEAIIGSKLPNLTYMLSFENDEAQKQGWANFLKDPDWQKLSKNEAYKDTVSNITNLLLRPIEGSQI